MKHVWSVLCQSSIRDASNKKISIINITDVVGVIVSKEKKEKRLFVNISLELVSYWSSFDKDAESFVVGVDFISPDNKKLIETESEVKEPLENSKSVVTNLSFKRLPLSKEGLYLFKIKQKKLDDKNFKVVTEIPLNIKIKFA